MSGVLRYDGMIAPCGMNCEICIGHIREKNKCPGCREIDAYELSYGRKCNLRNINNLGIEKFVESEKSRWKCPECGELLCVHRFSFLKCGAKRN